jgi:hypothetical protein
MYSLKGRQSSFSKYNESEFSHKKGNAVEIFLDHVMYDCMRKGTTELGSLEITNQVISKYFAWDAE